MSKPIIMCLDDQREVLSALMKDLEEFVDAFEVIDCESAQEALEELETIEDEDGNVLLFVCDHIMPEKTGVEFLSELREESRFETARKILLTGLATHEDTIDAINRGDINFYISKPWKQDNLLKVIRQQLTHALIDSGQDHTPYMQWLDQETLYKILSKRV